MQHAFVNQVSRFVCSIDLSSDSDAGSVLSTRSSAMTVEAKASKRVTLVDVAEAAGVSRATASLVLRGSDLVAEETRERVEAAMRSLGYVYHRGAASLRQGRSQTVGLVVPDVTNPFFAELTVAIEGQLELAQHVALLGNTAETLAKQERLLAMLGEYRADGVLLCPAEGTRADTIHALQRAQLPVVLFTRDVDGVEVDYVGADNTAGSELAAAHLLAAGHRRIAFVGGPAGSSARRERLTGYHRALREAGLQPDPVLERSSPTTHEGGLAAVAPLLTQPEPPTAVLCYNDIVALGVMRGLERQGREVGRDVAVVGFDDIAGAAFWHPALTTVAVAPRRIGQEATTLLFERIEQPKAPPRRIILPPTLVVRESSAARSAHNEVR
jgi:LacI family transcriptional regulator